MVEPLQTLSLGFNSKRLEGLLGAVLPFPTTGIRSVRPPNHTAWLQALGPLSKRIFCLFPEPSRWRTPWSSFPQWLPMLAATTCRLLTTRTETTRPASPSLLPWKVSKQGWGPSLSRKQRVIKSQEWGSRGLLGRWSGRGGRAGDGWVEPSREEEEPKPEQGAWVREASEGHRGGRVEFWRVLYGKQRSRRG